MIIKKINWLAVFPFVSFLFLILSWVVVLPFQFNDFLNPIFLIISIMSSVYYAEELAHLIGDGLGSLLLALSVTVIEVGLIISIMAKADASSEAVARDTVFASVMIVCNGIVGLCLFLGGLKNKEVGFQFRGTNILLIILIMLSVFTFILPNYTTSVVGPYYNDSQLKFVSIISLLLYMLLIWVQTKSHQNYFTNDHSLKNEFSKKIISHSDNEQVPNDEKNNFDIETKVVINSEVKIKSIQNLFTKVGVVNIFALTLGLVSVIGFAKLLSPQLESAVLHLGFPKAVVGLIIATLVLLPEAITAVIAAKQNNLQSSLNLALGSGAASIALTIPVIGYISISQGQNLLLGVDPKNIIFLILTFIIGSLSLGNGKATAFHGVVHLLILISYFTITIIP